MATPKQTDPQFKLRMTHGLKEQIEEAAAANNRSMNAEIVARLEESFTPASEALLKATLVAESLRENLTKKIQNYDNLSRSLLRREQILQDREETAAEILANAENRAEEILEERRNELEEDYKFRQKMLRKTQEQADEYAGFTIAREKQFYEAIKALTGQEPPPVEPVPSVWKQRREADDE